MAQLTLSALLSQAMTRYGDGLALIEGDRRFTYRDLDARAGELAAFLRGEGVGRGDRIALHLRNCAEYVVADLAILKLCAVKVPLNELMSPVELAYCLDHSEATVLISHASLPLAADLPARLAVRISVADAAPPRSGSIAWEDARAPASGAAADRAGPDELALIAYTGGTTGHPKGVCHSQHRLAVNILATIICGDIRADEVMLLTTSLPHSAGYHLQGCLVQGGILVLAERFTPAQFVGLAQAHAVTWTFAVPTMLYRLLDHLGEDGAVPASLRTIVYGAAPMSRERLEQGLKRLGPIFIQLFGQTECPNFVTILSKADHLEARLLTSCGRPVAMLDVRIRKADGAIAAAGEVGEVEVASPYLLLEYYKNPAATAEALGDGWLKTGDLGYLDAGRYLFLVDRAKDMIVSGGMNVYSVEVEAALRQHPDILDAAVIGVPDPDWGEGVVAFVTVAQAIGEAEVRAFAKTLLGAYKVPKRVLVRDALPLTKYGKIDKKALRADLAATASGGQGAA